MKLCSFILCTFFLLLFSLASIYPQDSQDSIKVLKRSNDKSIDLNYLKGIESNNEGLKISASYYLGERKNDQAVIPLMKILHSDKSPEARIMAALSLFKIGDEKGIYAIKEASQMDNSDWVKKMCKIFYQMYLTNKETDKH